MDNISHQKTLVRRAISLAGGAAAVATELGINRLSVYEWVSNGRVPAGRAPTIERMAGGAVRCEEICPGVDWTYLRQTTPELATKEPAERPVEAEVGHG
ncbi:MAG: Cro/CI family transcriptional regulator [Pigmentiphaga sp.]